MTRADLSAGSSAHTIEARFDGRDTNNFNLLRLLAALAVMISHTYLVTRGKPAVPVNASLIGTLAVWVFFTISGFLVASSFLRATSLLDFCVARVLRIFPALICCILVTALLVGPLVSALPVAAYLGETGVWAFVLGNMSLFWETRVLPGVFLDHPTSFAEVTFWTLRHEALCYALLFAVGCFGMLRRRLDFAIFAAGYAGIWLLTLMLDQTLPDGLPRGVSAFRELSTCFVFGMAAYVYRAHVYINVILAAALIAATLLLWFTPLFHVLLPLTVAYTALWFAFGPRGILLRFNALGDYSYGIYIYGFLIQQLVWLTFGEQTPLSNFLFAVPPALLVAALSWHVIERPAIRARRWVVARLGRASGEKAASIPAA